jgi:hypothetical protein
MSGLNYFLRRMDSDVLDRKFIAALNKCSERYNSIKENYPQSLTWFKNFVTATLIMSVERMIELENEEGSRKIQDALIDYYEDEIEERWNELQEFGIRESITRILREETEGYKVNLVKKIINTIYDNISFIKESIYDGRPLLIIYFESDDTAANIESWFDEKISRDIREWTSGNIVVCPDWIFDWDERKKNADVFINTELIKYDNLGNVFNESILREESSAKKKISALIDEYGLYDAAKILGLSFTQIVKISDTPINPEIANQILIENMRKGNLTENYKEFIIHSSYDGVFYWETNTRTGHFSNDRVEQITVAATPFWDGLDYTPVEIDWFTLYDKDMVNPIYSMGGEGNYFKKFTHQTNFETVEELNVWYNEVYLPGVYDIIMNSLLPKVHRLVDYELNPR